MIVVKEIKVNNIVSKSSLQGYSYVINPYVGCTHSCLYCYACFIQQFTKHSTEKWGEFVDIKKLNNKLKYLKNKTVFMSSITDPYQPIEKDCKNTQHLLELLKESGCKLTIQTRSDLILRDLELLKQIDIKVAIPINTLDETFQKTCENAPAIKKRLNTLIELHKNKIYTILVVSPMFPFLCDYQKIITETKEFVDEYWFENLSLRQPFKKRVIEYIQDNFFEYYKEYNEIYNNKDNSYWYNVEKEISEFCEESKLNYKITFKYN